MWAVEVCKRLLARKRAAGLGAALVVVGLISFSLRPYINAAFSPPLKSDIRQSFGRW
jgi:hypothetical protein